MPQSDIVSEMKSALRRLKSAAIEGFHVVPEHCKMFN